MIFRFRHVRHRFRAALLSTPDLMLIVSLCQNYCFDFNLSFDRNLIPDSAGWLYPAHPIGPAFSPDNTP
jgi:hypothetical protein